MTRGSLLVPEIIGMTVTGAILAVGAWCGLIDYGAGIERFAALRGQFERSDVAVRSLESAVKVQRDRCEELDIQLQTRGALPDRSPVEADLSALSKLAVRNSIELVEVKPSGTRQYPGITELRYQVRGQGPFVSLLAFLREFELSPFWADITRLKLSAGPSTETDGRRTADLTISLFSSNTAPADEKGK